MSSDFETMALTVSIAQEWIEKYDPSALHFLGLAGDSQVVEVMPPQRLGNDPSGRQVLQASFKGGYSILALAVLERGEQLNVPTEVVPPPLSAAPGARQKRGYSTALLIIVWVLGGVAVVAGSVVGYWWLRARTPGKHP